MTQHWIQNQVTGLRTVRSTPAGETWANLATGAANSNDPTHYSIRMQSANNPNDWQYIERLLFLFDTSILWNAWDVSLVHVLSATFTIWMRAGGLVKRDGLVVTPDITVCGLTLSAPFPNIVQADHSGVTNVVYSDIKPYADIPAALQPVVFTFTPAGLAAIIPGNYFSCAVVNHNYDNTVTNPTWSINEYSEFLFSVPFVQLDVEYVTPPWLNIPLANNITAHTARLNAELTLDGGLVTQTRFVWGLTPAYGFASPWVPTAAGNFLVNITGLLGNTLYHFRAESSNSEGVFNTPDTTFTTLIGAPIVQTDPATGVT